MRVTALIVAAGSGSRMGGDLPKQFRRIGGKSVLAHAVDAMASHPRIHEVRIVISLDHEDQAAHAIDGRDVGRLVIGGATRADSVRAGLAAIDEGIVLVHDAARPFCPPDVIDRLLDAMVDHDGAVPVLAVADTLAKANNTIECAVDRAGVVRVQTPQAFSRQILLNAYASWTAGVPPTDEASVVRAAGGHVAAIEGSSSLEKLTSPADWSRAEAMIAANLVSRTGTGFDVHAFAGEGPVIMGGLSIPHPKGLEGHSDADVVLHSITDALLGAAALGDIGQHFPPTDARWKGADSGIFLAHAASLVREAGGVIDFIDCTVICEAPKIGPHREAMRTNVARILAIPLGSVSIKATTTERMGFTGRNEGIAAQASATIRMASS